MLISESWLFNRWQECVNEDTRRVDHQWNKKIEGTTAAFGKDRDFICEHQKDRTKRKTASSTHQNDPLTTNEEVNDIPLENSDFCITANKDPIPFPNRNLTRQKLGLRSLTYLKNP